LLPRTFAIYRDLWKTVPGTIPIDTVIESIAGVNIEEILMFTFAFTGRSQKTGGYFRLYTDVDSTDPELIALFERERQQAFVNWLTCGYKTFRELSREGLAEIPSPSHEKQRFKPPVEVPDPQTGSESAARRATGLHRPPPAPGTRACHPRPVLRTQKLFEN
jgi:hypothetical protein